MPMEYYLARVCKLGLRCVALRFALLPHGTVYGFCFALLHVQIVFVVVGVGSVPAVAHAALIQMSLLLALTGIFGFLASLTVAAIFAGICNTANTIMRVGAVARSSGRVTATTAEPGYEPGCCRRRAFW
jgi:hypothetical protein